MRVVVYGLWHLGCVTAACVAAAGNDVVGLDRDATVVEALQRGEPPLYEPGLAELITSELASERIRFTTDARDALHDVEIVWVTFDTPVDDSDVADVAFVRAELEAIADAIPAGVLVLVSSQVPVGFTGSLERDWIARGVRFAVSPENLRLGKAIEVFRTAERVIVGVRSDTDRPILNALFAPFTTRIEWMSVESAEMAKHALNAFLATSVTFINELARLCEVLGADAKEVERGLKSEARIGPKAYLSPGAAFAGGTLARDVRFLTTFGEQYGLATPLFAGVLASNELHKGWLQHAVSTALQSVVAPTVAVLGLTYKPGTSTLRRSSAIELCRWLHAQGIAVRGFDPAVRNLPDDLTTVIELATTAETALAHADLAVIATEWPEFRALTTEPFFAMRNRTVIDQNRLLAGTLGTDPRIQYIATGTPARISQPREEQ